MKYFGLPIAFFCFTLVTFAQKSIDIDQKLLQEMGDNSCLCIDSIQVINKSKKVIASEAGECIDKVVVALQLGNKLSALNIDTDSTAVKSEKKEYTLNLQMNQDASEYKNYYYELERYLMDHCEALKDKMANDEKENENSVSENDIAIAYYNEGIDLYNQGDIEGALAEYNKAVKVDPNFAFAWDNIGICHRKLNQFDEAIEAYEKSLSIDPNGIMPLQNIAIVYQYKKQYKKAVKAYQKLDKVDPDNPEVFYGMGSVYAVHLENYPKGLDYLCKAYNIYIEHNSPYRSDAEKLINYIHDKMKEEGELDDFSRILKENNIQY